MTKIQAYDSTLRDGAQAQGISYSIEDKLKIVQLLDQLGVSFIEAGNPGSNPKDMEFFVRVAALELKNAKIIAFGSTRKVNVKVEDDDNLLSAWFKNPCFWVTQTCHSLPKKFGIFL